MCELSVIAHDLKLVEHMSQRIAVMYLGRIVELMPREDLAERSLHPYTRVLRSAGPEIDPEKRRLRVLLHGELPSPACASLGLRVSPALCDRAARAV